MTAPISTSRKGRIAVIDDDAVFVDLMCDLLAAGEGYDVVGAPDWVRSIEFVRDVQPDLIILDLVLGRSQAGWRVLELLREDPSTARIPVILCSAAAPALRDYEASLLGQGAVATVSKPFDVEDLLTVVERLMRPTASAIV